MPRVPARTSPFDVSGKHISALSSESLVELVQKLLHAEAVANGIPADSIGETHQGQQAAGLHKQAGYRTAA